MDFPIYIGTSGWNYETFIGSIFDKKTPKRKYLETYCKFFNSVELNASFYRSFPKRTWEGWYNRTPDGFIWSVKASRFITHIKRLDVDKDSIDYFFSQAGLLREKLGVVLFQLPPTLEFKRETFLKFLKLLPFHVPVALEARHGSWFKKEVYEILKEKGLSFVISHTAGKYPIEKVFTADFLYIRLHGANALYRGSYGEEGLKEWIDLIRVFSKKTFIYFDNTADGSAAKDALLLKKLLHEGT